MLSIMALRRLVVAACVAFKAVNAGDSVGECLLSSKDENSFFCYSPKVFDKSLFCEDTNDKCSEWASKSECARNPRFMLAHCPKSCDSCISPHTGSVQVIHDDDMDHESFFAKFVATHEYIQDRIGINPHHLKSCRNLDATCVARASKGECATHASFMKEKCPAACEACRL